MCLYSNMEKFRAFCKEVKKDNGKTKPYPHSLKTNSSLMDVSITGRSLCV